MVTRSNMPISWSWRCWRILNRNWWVSCRQAMTLKVNLDRRQRRPITRMTRKQAKHRARIILAKVRRVVSAAEQVYSHLDIFSLEPIVPELHVSAVTSKPTATSTGRSSTTKKPATTVKTPQPLTATGATWVNSNRSNRGTSSSSSLTSNGSGSITVWNNPSTTTKPLPQPSKLMSSTHYPATISNASSYHYTYANSNQTHYGHPSKPVSSRPSSKTEPSSFVEPSVSSHNSHLLSPAPLVPSQPGHRIPIPHSSKVSSTSSSDSISPPASSSLLVVSGGYNPFASNILTTSIVDVLTKPKDSAEENNAGSTTKMNFANVAKMNVQSKGSHHEPIVITMDEPTSPPLPDPKIAPGYRGPPSAGTTPIHHQQQQQQLLRTSNFDPHSSASHLSRAPGANRHQQSISPSMNKVLLDQNGHTGSSTASSTSSSPSSLKQQTHPSMSIDQQPKPFGAIGSHRMPLPPPTTTDASFTENPLQMRAKFNRTLSANNTPNYQPTPTPPMMMNNPAYANLSRSRSNLNPSAPEFQHFHRLSSPFIPPNPTAVSNGPVSANIMNIARMMEQKQQPAPMYPAPPPVRPTQAQASDLERMQHVQNQVLHFFQMHANQPHVPPPPQLPTTLQIASLLASSGHLPPDPNQAAAVVAAYYYKNFMSRNQPPNSVPMTNNVPLGSTVNTNGYETINTLQSTHPNSDEIPLGERRDAW